MEWTASCGGLLFLAVLTPDDIRERKISVGKLIIGMLSALICRGLTAQMELAELAGSLLPGMIIFLLAVVFRESIGNGDGLVVMVLGLWLGGFWTLLVVSLAIMLAGLFAVICLFRRKEDTIPLIPFLLLGMEVLLFYA